MKRDLKKMYLMLILAVLGFGMTSCTTEDNPAEPVTPSDDPVAAWLSAIPGVSDVQILIQKPKSDNPVKIYDFRFDQLIDHKNPAKGTFKQRVTMVYNDPSATNVLLTEGYAISENPDSISLSGISTLMMTNEICVEYRYFGNSLPEAFDNLDFTYLNSEQASADLHAVVSALKQSGQFPQKWIATGVSKSGITSALYAYYDEKNGWNDIDVYVPFCAPFCESLTDTRIGSYIEKSSLAHFPEAEARYEAFFKSLFTNTYLGNYLLQKTVQTQPAWIETMKKQGLEDNEIYWAVVHYNAVQCQRSQFSRVAYVPIQSWASLIPSATASTEQELKWAYTFIYMGDEELEKELKNRASSGTRVTMTEEQREGLLIKRAKDRTMPYAVQAAFELGDYAITYDFLKGTQGLFPSYLDYFEKREQLAFQFPMYVGQYNNAMTMDFINNFLPKTSKKMVFVYGGQDTWTGAAIPDPTNSNVKKIIVPGGVHCDNMNDTRYYTKEYSDKIMALIKAFLQ